MLIMTKWASFSSCGSSPALRERLLLIWASTLLRYGVVWIKTTKTLSGRSFSLMFKISCICRGQTAVLLIPASLHFFLDPAHAGDQRVPCVGGQLNGDPPPQHCLLLPLTLSLLHPLPLSLFLPILWQCEAQLKERGPRKRKTPTHKHRPKCCSCSNHGKKPTWFKNKSDHRIYFIFL